MEKTNAAKIITSRKLITRPGKYTVKVTNVTDYHRDLGNGIAQVAIANFNAMTDFHLSSAKQLLQQGEYQEATNQNLSHSIRSNDYRPEKGEYVDIMVDEITSNNDVTGLFVVGLSPVKASKTASIEMEDLLSDDKGSERAELITDEDKEKQAKEKQFS